MPFAIAAPPTSIEPPRALTPLTVVEIARGVEIPQHAAVAGRKGAEVAVDRSAEHRAGNRRGRRRQRRAARRLVAAARWDATATPACRRRCRMREQPAADFRVQPAAPALRRLLERDVGQRHVHVLSVAGRSPFDAAELAAAADRRAPQLLAALIRIEAVHHAGLLPGDDHALAVGERHQDRRLAEVVIRALLSPGSWSVSAVPHAIVKASPAVVCVRPLDRAGFQIERDDRIGRRRRGHRVGVAGRDVQRLGDRIHRRRRPDGRARRSPQLRALRVLRARRRRLRDHVGAPQICRRSPDRARRRCRETCSIRRPACAPIASSTDETGT